MVKFQRRNRQEQCRATRRIMTILLLVLIGIHAFRLGLSTLSSGSSINKTTNKDSKDNENIVILTLKLDDTINKIIDIRIQLYSQESPLAAAYIQQLASDPNETCQKCTLYRGERVPSYWGSPDYPDRYFDGGRWGPPYALVQGGFLSDSSSPTTTMSIPPAESHTPVIQRGMVAWAGGKGGPHFFIALADHPEWKHQHTVFGNVVTEDMPHVDALLQRPLTSTKPKQPPIVSNFVTPIPFTIQMMH